MIPCRLLGVCAAVAGALVLTTAFASQDKGKEIGKAKPASAPAVDPEMMAKWKAYATPGPDHKILEAMVGTWTSHSKMWMDPAGPADESDGSSDVKSVFDGRFIHESYKGEAMGQPFEGTGLFGFDNFKKKYVGTWCDTMGTGIMNLEGTYDSAKKAITYTGECPDHTMSKMVPTRLVCTFVDANTHKLEMFSPDKSGKEFRCMEITYTRGK